MNEKVSYPVAVDQLAQQARATAPMVGGQSWLAHGSVASGLWLDTQARNRAMLASPRRTLFHYAQDAGLRTVAIAPTHTTTLRRVQEDLAARGLAMARRRLFRL